ncbi:unnamed protein product [Thelazia callipaeda]|uniref:Uncharacterized protein n=1 Tax=Thelazia callipaeda TaxID=103827 RepID=A0A0N5DAE6_THECL|nr:unnamed protein product [Thelazia callipaeda]
MKELVKEIKEATDFKWFPKSKPQLVGYQYPVTDAKSYTSRQLSNQRNRKTHSIARQLKQITNKIYRCILIYLESLICFLVQPVPLPSQSILPIVPLSTSMLLQPTSPSLRIPCKQQQHRFPQFSLQLRTKRNCKITYTRKWFNKGQLRSKATSIKESNSNERIIYVPIMNNCSTRTVRPKNYSLERFAVECFTRK